MSRSIFSGPLGVLTKETDGALFIPADQIRYSVGTWTWTRIAAGDYVQRKTAGDNTSVLYVDLTTAVMRKYGTDPITSEGLKPGQSHDIRGFQLTAIDFIYRVETAALDAHTAALTRNTLANNVAPAVTTPSTLTGSLATATQATHPYITTLTCATPYVLGNNSAYVQDFLEWTINAAATSAVDVYGVVLKFNYNLL